jgi:hypothetical protein
MAATPWRRILFGFALIFCIGPAAAAEPVYPQLSGRIVDDADLLSATDLAELDAELKALEDKSSDQVVVVTLPSLQGFTVNGASSSNTLQYFRGSLRVPIVGPVGVGGGYSWYSRRTGYSRFAEDRRTQSEWRIFLDFAFAQRWGHPTPP